MTTSEIWTQEAKGQYLVHTPRVEEAHFHWLDPEAWGLSAQPVAEGGRGAAWFLSGPRGEWVLRHYRRGGLPARLLKQRYLFLGRHRVRAVREFRLLESLHHQGLPVPRPVIAGYERGLFSYRAAIIVERLPDTRPLLSFQSPDDAVHWSAAGRCIRRFHDAGVFHADLNPANILIQTSTGKVFLIDFDRGCQHHHHRPDTGWKQANLRRLSRGVHKYWPETAKPQAEQLLQALLRDYRLE
ncbi:3-deoxy-D-manno-octulosonic acid kinase [Marinimicrobium sp. ARAG 43.8]|uniref:3-deoxy-D-manno-octulosonic acid kinase n=1 Tax=Marinimicrobium sp. ARAG 43.8 TaxID=3418719 RepID=UPI003CE818B4